MNESTRGGSWKWGICALLLLATVINYMDRQTLASVAVRITREFRLNEEQYGDLELAFGWAFGGGALFFGVLVDRYSVRWMYPVVLTLWSLMGFLTGYAETYGQLLLCRTLLGFFESAHWPCAIRTTQLLLAPEQRTMGNSVLQSGAALGAIVTPLLMNWMLAGAMAAGAWRVPFQIIGAAGVLWAFVWFACVRESDFRAASSNIEPTSQVGIGSLWQILADRRFWVLAFVIVCINSSWQLIRAWLPKFLQQGRGYTESYALYFNSAYFVATDVGCLGAGILSLELVRRGFTVHRSRMVTYAVFAVLVVAVCGVPFLPRGWLLLTLLLVAGAGALGVFPCYHAFTQELTTTRMGLVVGMLSAAGWLASGLVSKGFGRLIDATGSFDAGLAAVGLAPLAGGLALALFWPRESPGRRV